MSSIEIPTVDWVILLNLLAKSMAPMSAAEKLFCLKLAGQIRYQTTDQAFDQTQKELT